MNQLHSTGIPQVSSTLQVLRVGVNSYLFLLGSVVLHGISVAHWGSGVVMGDYGMQASMWKWLLDCFTDATSGLARLSHFNQIYSGLLTYDTM